MENKNQRGEIFSLLVLLLKRKLCTQPYPILKGEILEQDFAGKMTPLSPSRCSPLSDAALWYSLPHFFDNTDFFLTFSPLNNKRVL